MGIADRGLRSPWSGRWGERGARRVMDDVDVVRVSKASDGARGDEWSSALTSGRSWVSDLGLPQKGAKGTKEEDWPQRSVKSTKKEADPSIPGLCVPCVLSRLIAFSIGRIQVNPT